MATMVWSCKKNGWNKDIKKGTIITFKGKRVKG
jgi:hypothetical protein